MLTEYEYGLVVGGNESLAGLPFGKRERRHALEDSSSGDGAISFLSSLERDTFLVLSMPVKQDDSEQEREPASITDASNLAHFILRDVCRDKSFKIENRIRC